MNIKRQICEAFCGGFDVRPVPVGYAIKSPFDWFTGDALVFYARIDGERVRFEDDGATFAELEGSGVDLSSDSRLNILDTLLKAHGVRFDQNEFLFHSDWFPESQAGRQSARFLSFLNRLQDLLFTTRERVAGTFKEDLVAALKERFYGSAEVSTDEAPISSLNDYVVDIVVKHQSGRIAAIYPGTSEQRALEAVLFSKEMELRKIPNVVPFLIYEQTNTNRVSRRTQSRALNSDLQMAAWDGGRNEVLEKVAKYVSQQAV